MTVKITYVGRSGNNSTGTVEYNKLLKTFKKSRDEVLENWITTDKVYNPNENLLMTKIKFNDVGQVTEIELKEKDYK